MRILLKTIPIVCFFLVSCVFTEPLDNVNTIQVNNSNESCKKVDYSIPIDSALSELALFLDNDLHETSRSNGKRIVKTVSVIQVERISRSVSDSMNCDNLLYIANFDKEQGYAVLAADSRISEKIIAVIDSGSLSDNVAYQGLDMAVNDRANSTFDNYPAYGPGFFTQPETGDELYINPNTVNLYIEEENDTLVGNFFSCDESEYGRVVLNNVEPEAFSAYLYSAYALNEIDMSDKRDEYEYVPDEIIKHGGIIGGIGGGDSEGQLIEVVSAGEWKNIKRTSSLLQQFRSWRQSVSPFNDLSPYRHKYLIFGEKKKAPVGCFPLAIAKILTNEQLPYDCSYNGYKINWDEISKWDPSVLDFPTVDGRLSISHLLRYIGSSCESWYFYGGTFTFPSKVIAFLKKSGLKNVSKTCYSFEKVAAMIDNNAPMIIFALPGVDITKSHSWIIDGYKIKEREISKDYYLDNTLYKTINQIEECKMVHCDFCWGGAANGYYVSGVFNLQDSNAELDYGPHDNKENYNSWIRLITYNR